MKRHIRWWYLGFLVVPLCLGVASSAAVERQAWEYTVTDDLSGTQLNRLGGEGWEVAAAVQDEGGRIRVILKRMKQ